MLSRNSFGPQKASADLERWSFGSVIGAGKPWFLTQQAAARGAWEPRCALETNGRPAPATCQVYSSSGLSITAFAVAGALAAAGPDAATIDDEHYDEHDRRAPPPPQGGNSSSTIVAIVSTSADGAPVPGAAASLYELRISQREDPKTHRYVSANSVSKIAAAVADGVGVVSFAVEGAGCKHGRSTCTYVVVASFASQSGGGSGGLQVTRCL